ncbi:MAG: hypothetical protein AB7F67_26490 [Rhodospirillaceae bacterium]
MNRDAVVDKLIEVATPYWEAEGEIARRFFATAKPEDHVFYLKAQLWKELHPVDGFFNGLHRELAELVEMFPKVDKEVDRHHYHFLLMQLTQEFNHYVLLADIFEYLVGRKITPDDTVQLAEEKKLGDLRRRYVQSGSPLDRAAVAVTEGGGARLFREGAKLKGDKLADMTAKAMQTIFDDEKDHFMEQAKEAADAVASDGDLARMIDAVIAVSRQRVAMRNEMFLNPMTEAEIEGFIAAQKKAA